MSAAGLTAALTTHIADTGFAALPASTVLAAKRALLDGVGVILAASGLAPETSAFVELARTQPSPTGATVLGQGIRAAPSAAALANGAMSHALDFEDAFDLAPVHPNASLIPAAIAIAQTGGLVDGRTFITAIALGCDLACRLGLSLRKPMEEGGWYPPPILASFGAAAAAAKCLKLLPEQIGDAFSLMLCQVSCPGEIKNSADTVIRSIREAFPAQAAVTSVQLALRGVRGFDAPLEGKAGFFRLYADGEFDPDTLLANLGERYWIDQLSFKRWPACRGTHAYIEAAQELSRELGFDWKKISQIELEVGEVQQMLAFPEERKRRPATAIDAKFSLPFTVATAFVQGDVTLTSFEADTLHDTAVLALAERISSRCRPEWDRSFATAGAMTVRLQDGSAHRAEILDPLGSPRRPLSDAQLHDKFVDCAGRAARPISKASIDELAARILSLEAEPDVGRLFQNV